MTSYKNNCNVSPAQEACGGGEPHPGYDLKCEQIPSSLPHKPPLVQRGMK